MYLYPVFYLLTERVKITVPPDDYTGSGAVNLNCETRGFPQALVYWTKDGHIVTSGGH